MTASQVEIMRAALENGLAGVSNPRKDALAESLVHQGWRKFDTDSLVFMSEISRRVGVSITNATKWWKRHADEVPPPQLVITLPNGAKMAGWDKHDAEIFVNAYTESRMAYAGSTRGKRIS